MSKFTFVLAILTTPGATPTASTEMFECREANPIIPQLTIVRTEDDRRYGQQSFTYEADGQRVFGLPAKYLSHLRERNGESGLDEFNYTAVVQGDLNLVRWLFERVNPNMRCIRNGSGYSCITATSGGGYHKARSASIFSISKNESYDYASGIVIDCRWMENPTPRK